MMYAITLALLFGYLTLTELRSLLDKTKWNSNNNTINNTYPIDFWDGPHTSYV